MVEKLQLTDADWRQRLTEEQFKVLRRGGTEPAFRNAFWDNHSEGVYHCAGCDLPLFDSADKFDSGTGWPSFTKPIASDAVYTRVDDTFGMVRTEVLCERCDGHLGHLFDDGPPPTRQRYCMNSASLRFEPRIDSGRD